MTDVFIYYARSTEPTAARIDAALQAQGYSVWRDDRLPEHRDYTDVLEERLAAAKAVLVIWSADAVKSQWVRAEADAARDDGKLIQLSLGGVRPPMPFNRIQCADVTDWNGEPGHAGWRKIIASVVELAGAAPASAAQAREPAARPAPAEPLLAVLAFDNLSGDADLAYFSDGVSEEILDTVARGADLRVIARSSSFQFRGAHKAARNVAAELNATHLLDGSVRRAGQRVRIAAQLVDCASETTLWSNRFDRELTDVFALQDEIAAEVAAALKVTLARTPRPEGVSPGTYEAYLKAQAMVADQVVLYLDGEVVGLLEDVVAAAPTFAAAWEALAYVQAATLRSGAASVRFAEGSAAATEAAHRALALDPGRGRAYIALAILQPWGAYAERLALFERAMAASPNDSQVMMWTASGEGQVGRARAFLDLARRMIVIDPRSAVPRISLNLALGSNGLYEEALRHADDWVRLPAPTANDFVAALANAVIVRDWERYDRYAALKPADMPLMPVRNDSYARFMHNMRTEDRAGMQEALAEMQGILAETGTVPLNRLTELSLYGMYDEAFDLVERATFEHMFDPAGAMPSAIAPSILFDPHLDGGLPHDPRFPSLAAKLGLADYWLRADRWPDCADAAPYDFRAEVRRAAGR